MNWFADTEVIDTGTLKRTQLFEPGEPIELGLRTATLIFSALSATVRVWAP